MKSLILSAQDARELEKLGGLTVSKQIKPAPRYIQGAEFTETAPGWVLHIPGVRRLGAGDGVADVFAPPVNAGDAVYIREPWYRLRDPKTDEPSDRVILAADAVIGEGQTAYKWASPVSMPEEQARRFARVRRVSPVYGENVAAWEIELEKVAADVARAIDAGLPYSTAQGEEGASDYYTVAGDMTAEDRERMVEAIDKDRARLYQVQNRLVWIELRRRELANILADPTAADHYDLDLAKGQIQTIEQQKADLADEEADLRAALEDAGAPAPTVEEMARERLDSVRSEIEAAALDPNRAEALAQLEQLERDLSAYIDAAAEGAEEAQEEPREDAPAAADTGDAPENGEAQEAQDAPTEGEPGSYTIGKCKYCGREWGVTLEGAEGGGYPTQRTANAAATRLCDCPEAVANRAPIVGVAFAVTRGTCQYCGQLQEVGPHPSQAAADETASEVCNCQEARTARRVREQIEDAQERVQRLFGDGAENLGFKPVHVDAVSLLESVVELIARGPISSATINVRGQCKAKFSVTSKGKIKVSRSETRSCDLEAGE